MTGKAWLVSALGAVRTYGGNDGYRDEPATTYRWDSNVPNAGKPAKGDFIVVRNKRVSIGASVIERVAVSKGQKELRYCPNPDCKASDINPRTTLTPMYRCSKCKFEFEIPVSRIVEVKKYVATYEAAWTELASTFTARELLEMCDQAGAQHSIREIDWRKFASAVVAKTGEQLVGTIERRRDAIEGGHAITTTRVRRGQRAFRQTLLADYGPVCAFTGPAPVDVLDAAHLYSFAKVGRHHKHGGLLLRKDMHQLFDLGQLAVHPESRRISVAGLADYPDYARLDAAELHVELQQSQVEWFRAHWNEHRA